MHQLYKNTRTFLVSANSLFFVMILGRYSLFKPLCVQYSLHCFRFLSSDRQKDRQNPWLNRKGKPSFTLLQFSCMNSSISTLIYEWSNAASQHLLLPIDNGVFIYYSIWYVDKIICVLLLSGEKFRGLGNSSPPIRSFNGQYFLHPLHFLFSKPERKAPQVTILYAHYLPRLHSSSWNSPNGFSNGFSRRFTTKVGVRRVSFSVCLQDT